VGARARAAGDPAAVEAVRLFAQWLGAVAGDLALTLGARGGVYFGGGVIGGLGAAFDRAACLARFEAKGRFESYLRAVPVRHIVAPDAALRGAAAALSAAAGR
jgi:glucokinase